MALTVIKGNGIKTTLKGALFDDIILGWGVTQILGGFADANINLAETMYGGGGADTIYGGGGADVLYGEAGSDWLYGGTGNDKLYGGAAADHLFGGDGGDTVDGGDGADDLLGDAGNDTLLGGAGTDTLTGGLGNDSLNGGNGADDVAVFNCTAEEAVILHAPFGGLMTITSPEGVDVVTNVEWLRFYMSEGDFPEENPFAPFGAGPGAFTREYNTLGVIARNDAASAAGNDLDLTAATLLANDISLKPGATLSIVSWFDRAPLPGFDPIDPAPVLDPIIGSTWDGVLVYMSAAGDIYFNPNDPTYNLIPAGQTVTTYFNYQVSNGSGFNDYAQVEVTITGTNLIGTD
jgi:hypothetical protein